MPSFIWTEPHSKRIKVKLKVQKEVVRGAVLEQFHEVEFFVKEFMCESCMRVEANPDQCVALVQLRQQVPHRRTLFYLEQVILKHGAATNAVKIVQTKQGIDFSFGKRSHGVRFLEFLGKVAPVKPCDWQDNKHLKSHDSRSYNYNYNYALVARISPICREDLICLPPEVAASLGNFRPLVICTKVTGNIVLLDPFSLRHCFMESDHYWRASFESLLTSRQLVEYIVLDVEIVSHAVNVGGSKYALADAHVARLSDFGNNDTIFSTRTHLGHILKPGDYALGYDLYGANFNDSELEKHKNLVLPDAILIKKSYEEKRGKKRGKPRSWKLKFLDIEIKDKGKAEQDKMRSEYEQFLKDLEENPDMRFNVSLYRNKEYQPSDTASMTDGEDVPSIPLEELLADLDLSEDEDGDSNMVG
ncbi:hypothetical protein L484_000634 [Morus notabilis]|uniref:60S ribosomal export protein NMD3 n=1 Tax=Morus notabilis TaxID=981085 RepID=W9QN80_9ROSA|nr:hypothetical protein L484_000634 [Morus notabilis]